MDVATLLASILLIFLMARAGNVFADHADINIGLRRKDVKFEGNMMFVIRSAVPKQFSSVSGVSRYQSLPMIRQFALL
jgi:hypothetical protein